MKRFARPVSRINFSRRHRATFHAMQMYLAIYFHPPIPIFFFIFKDRIPWKGNLSPGVELDSIKIAVVVVVFVSKFVKFIVIFKTQRLLFDRIIRNKNDEKFTMIDSWFIETREASTDSWNCYRSILDFQGYCRSLEEICLLVLN